ncbi:hypothetical protein GE061_017269, partial [Apolygus lucorum]
MIEEDHREITLDEMIGEQMMLTGEEAIIGEDHIKKEESSESDLMVEEEMIIEEELFEEVMHTENIKQEVVNHSSSPIVTDVAECWVVLRKLTEDEIFRWSSKSDEDLPSGDLECGVQRS